MQIGFSKVTALLNISLTLRLRHVWFLHFLERNAVRNAKEIHKNATEMQIGFGKVAALLNISPTLLTL